ncbi:MAG: hypothetical protein ACTSRZ_02280 [Promethearchaeota archaeon]
MIDLFQIQLGIIRFLELLFYIVIVIVLNSSNKVLEETGKKSYLKTSFIQTFLYWIYYMILDIIAPLIVGLSFSENFIMDLFITESEEPLLFFGVTPISLLVGNILRDIQFIFASIFIYSTYKNMILIRWGRSIGEIRYRRRFISIILIIGMIFVVTFDYGGVAVYKYYIKVVYNFSNFALIGIFVYLLVISYACTSLIAQVRSGKNKISESVYLKLRNFMIGYSFICAGMWYWILMPLIPFKLTPLFLQLIGHLLWILAPLFIGYALIQKRENEIDNI